MQREISNIVPEGFAFTLKKKNPLDFVLYESIFVVLIYWEICLRTDFRSRQTLYTLLCRTCATLSCKAVVFWHPHHCSHHENKNLYFLPIFSLTERHNLSSVIPGQAPSLCNFDLTCRQSCPRRAAAPQPLPKSLQRSPAGANPLAVP